MKKTSIFLLIAYFLVSPALAGMVRGNIVDIDRGDPNQESLLFLENGRVLWINQSNKALKDKIEHALHLFNSQHIEYDNDTGKIKRFIGTNQNSIPSKQEDSVHSILNVFEPTVFQTKSAAQNAFNSLDKRTKSDSQCYNRAHGWAYDLWRTRSVQSQKLFLFFTSKYIREYRYKWWFHVIPMVLISSTNGNPVEHTLDRSFTRGPLLVRTWTNIFMKNNAECRSVTWYDDYRQNQNAQWCYLIRATHFYRDPRDLKLLDRNGRQETKWNESEIRFSRRQAFIHWRRYNP